MLSYGTRLAECLAAADALDSRGLRVTVADARFVKPLDTDLITRLAREHSALITIEEGAVGGFASHVMQFLATAGLLDHGLKLRPMVLPDVFLDHATPTAQYSQAGLDSARIIDTVLAPGAGAGRRNVARVAKKRLDQILVERLAESRTRAQALIRLARCSPITAA